MQKGESHVNSGSCFNEYATRFIYEFEERSVHTLADTWNLAAGAPMWLLSWVVYPRMSAGLSPVNAGLLRMNLLAVGLLWEFVLSLIILYSEEGNIRLSTIRRRFWLNHPVSPRTGETKKALWWWIIPLILLVALL